MRDEIRRRNTSFGLETEDLSTLTSTRGVLFRAPPRPVKRYEPTYKLSPDEKPEARSVKLIIDEMLKGKIKTFRKIFENALK